MGSSTDSFYASLTSEARDFMFENGRRYHGYKAGRYLLPNDEPEMDREDMKHHMTLLLADGRLHLAPIGPSPGAILDIGTGTGIWAIQMADVYPDARVVATDLSPIQPAWTPPNLVIEIDDVEEGWLYKPHSLDFIHARYLFLAVRDWPRVLNQAAIALRPGGWFEFVEFSPQPISPDNTFPQDSQIVEWAKLMGENSRSHGFDLEIAPKFKGLMLKAGFVDVQEVVFDCPLGDWMTDPRMKEIGLFHHLNVEQGLQGISSGLLTRIAGWSVEQVEVFLAGVRREMNDSSVHCLHKVYFVWGRTPGERMTGSENTAT